MEDKPAKPDGDVPQAESLSQKQGQELYKKVMFITGGAGGLGTATAERFVKGGWRVFLVDRDPAILKVKAEALGGPDTAQWAQVDVTSAKSMKDSIQVCQAAFGRVDAAFNIVGIEGERMLLHEYSEEAFDMVMRINCKGTFLSMKYELEAMMGQEPLEDGVRGCVVNCSAMAGLHALPERSAYAASKCHVLGLTKTAAAEYAPYGIRINAVCPAATETPKLQANAAKSARASAETQRVVEGFPWGRVGQAEEVAETVFFLCSGSCNFIIGESIALGGGMGLCGAGQ